MLNDGRWCAFLHFLAHLTFDWMRKKRGVQVTQWCIASKRRNWMRKERCKAVQNSLIPRKDLPTESEAESESESGAEDDTAEKKNGAGDRTESKVGPRRNTPCGICLKKQHCLGEGVGNPPRRHRPYARDGPAQRSHTCRQPARSSGWRNAHRAAEGQQPARKPRQRGGAASASWSSCAQGRADSLTSTSLPEAP